jgi:hypothetical protein
MQIRRAFFPANSTQPLCPFDHVKAPCLQKHGHYKRYSQPDGDEKTLIPRFLCKFTGKTISILPDQFLPYRAVNLPVVEAHFDQLADSTEAVDSTQDIAPAPCQIEQGCLIRAWKRFSSAERVASLTGFFGQRLPRLDSPEALWKAIRQTAGDLSQILLELATQGKSLLGDSRCLKPC